VPKHIVRLLILIAAGLVVGLFAKWYFTADSFYRYGHYRADSVPEIAAQAPVFQTPHYCQSCHSARYAQWSANNHKTVICEVCHGPAKGHPQNGKLPIPKDTRKLCTLCHEAMPSRPRAQPQIDLAKHSGGQQCVLCHNPHSPKIGTVVAEVTGNAVEGKKQAAACTSCHGENGISPNDEWPNLAGQHAPYLAKMLTAYKTGTQKDVMMSSVASALDNAEIQNLAAYFSGLSCRGAAASTPSTGNPVTGKALALKNCATCHGETGITKNAAWPKLAGQKAGYLANMLKAFRAGLRKDPMMGSVVRGLSDTDIADLAAYYGGQACEVTASGKAKP